MLFFELSEASCHSASPSRGTQQLFGLHSPQGHHIPTLRDCIVSILFTLRLLDDLTPALTLIPIGLQDDFQDLNRQLFRDYLPRLS